MGVDTVEKEKIIQDARNMFIFLYIDFRFDLGDNY